MTGFTPYFGGPNVNPSQLSFAAYTIAADLPLTWPFEALDGVAVAADKLDIVASLPGLSLILPDARLVTVGSDLLITNRGAETFVVKSASGVTLASIASGLSWYFYLTDNTTLGGIWNVIQYAAGVSSANAGQLAGFGLRASASQLDQNLISVPLASNYTFTANDRAQVFRNNSGARSYNFPVASDLGNGWFVYVINAGSGNLTLTSLAGPDIDGAPTKVLAPSESCIIFSDGTNYWSLGYGRSLVTTVTGANINLAGAGTLALNATQVAAQVQDFTGALTGARIVEYGALVGFWFVNNQTTGAFATTFKTNSIDPGVVVPQGNFSILRSNGTSMEIAFTATTGTVTLINTVSGDLIGGPISSSGTLGLANTAVIPGTYGGIGLLTAFIVDQKGRLVQAEDAQLNIKDSAPCTTAEFAAVITGETGTGAVVFGTGPTLDSPIMTGNPTAPTPPPGDNDTTVPTTAFVQAAIAAAIAGVAGYGTGDIKWTLDDVQQAGFLWLNGKTLGNAASGASGLASPLAEPLFTFFWNKYSDALCPVSGGRGASPALDFASNKTLTMLDSRGCVLAAPENMGGTNRNNLGTNPSVGGFSGVASLGQQAGQKSHAQTGAELASHIHTMSPTLQGFNGGAGVSGGGNAMQSAGSFLSSTDPSGSNTPANVTQPTLMCNVLVKL